MSHDRDRCPWCWWLDRPFLAWLALLPITSGLMIGLALLLMHWTS